MKTVFHSGELKFDEAAYAAGKLEIDKEVIHIEEKRADNGYTLICNSNGQAVYLIDMKGRGGPPVGPARRDDDLGQLHAPGSGPGRRTGCTI